MDKIENSDEPTPEVNDRLAQRRAEKEQLQRKLQSLQSAERKPAEPPSESWIASQFANLKDVLNRGGPAAAFALRKLLGDAIVVKEVRLPGRKRHYLQGEFSITMKGAMQAMDCARSADAPEVVHPAEHIVLDFRLAKPAEMLADKVKACWDKGMTRKRIGEECKCKPGMVDKALAEWYRQRGLARPHGNRKRGSAPATNLPAELSEHAKELWDQDLLLVDIAAELGCCRDTAAEAIEYWFESRGLKAPDGRMRRISLERKSCNKSNDQQEPSDGLEHDST